jgi:hypothetical protein
MTNGISGSRLFSFAPVGATALIRKPTHGLRRGLHSCAALRLETIGFPESLAGGRATTIV